MTAVEHEVAAPAVRAPAARGALARRAPVGAPGGDRRSGRMPARAVAGAAVVGAAGVAGVALTALGASQVAVEAAALLVRVVLVTGVLVAVGGAVFVGAVHDGRGHERARIVRLVRAAAIAGMAASALSVPLHAAVVQGSGFAGASDARTLAAVAASPFGAAALLRLAGLCAVALGVGRPRTGALVTGAGVLVALAGFTLTGHSATADTRWLAATVTVVHAGAAGVWLGGLLLLGVVLAMRRGSFDASGGARLLGRFSTVAAASVAALVPTGTALAAREVGSLGGLVSSGYGRTLLVKVALVAVVLALAAHNRWRLVPAIDRDGPAAWRRLQRTVRAELAGLLLAVAVTGALVRLAPPG
ncbi:MAG TPA: CopD family protein [Egibacteraceae bacterium]|nr:CopD family protein [Egibacteraceae bacterium]